MNGVCKYLADHAKCTYVVYPKAGFHLDRCFVSKVLANAE